MNRPSPVRLRVTIVVGFSCEHCLVVGSDSQSSDGASTFQQWDEKKVVFISFADGTQAILAKAGGIRVGNLYQEAFEAAAKTATPNAPRAIASIAEQAIKETRDKILAAYYHPTFEAGSGKTYVDENHSVFMLAYYFGGQPYLYTLDLAFAYASPVKGRFEAIGCAGNLARFILEGFDFKSMSFGLSFGVASYAIAMCKRHDQACGGPIQLAAVDQTGKAMDMDSLVLETAENAIVRVHAESQRTLPEKLIAALVEEVNKRKAEKAALEQPK